MSETDHDPRQGEIAAYLLGALEPDEAAALERHFAACVECRTELEWLRPAMQVLPESVERIEPSPALRARVMEEVRADAPQPQPTASRSTASGFRHAILGRLRPRVGLRPIAGLAAVALVFAVAIGYFAGDDRSGDGTSTVWVGGAAPGVMAKMVRSGDSGTLHLANVRPLPEGKVLEAWVRRDGRIEPVRALFVPDRSGKATTTIADMRGVDTVMVTAEPAGGSDQPTSAPIVTMALPQ
jgi:anti-sigma-K factor RskA